nr:hypothetical protein [Candidatus Midichloria mitochondrii]
MSPAIIGIRPNIAVSAVSRIGLILWAPVLTTASSTEIPLGS